MNKSSIQIQQHHKNLYKSTEHWKSTYNHTNDTSGIENRNPNKRPEWSLNKTVIENKRRVVEPFNHTLNGKYGYVPRKKLNSEYTKIKVEKNEITYF